MSVVVSTPDPGLIGKFYMQMSKEICLHKFFLIGPPEIQKPDIGPENVF